ncbi:unnamed protein product [Dracunculus medinensis]|uniref:Uncharacterized protein n=1 Tax=Dracunculus medinensis TaxID=318479 RepID=A0A3P7PV90_DRAME|nr:unnamed protein product [Dracunculus medinensis]
MQLQKEKNASEHLLRKVELAESETFQRKKETEAKEVERIDAHQQCKKMLSMVEDRDSKIRRMEELIERHRDEVGHMQIEINMLAEQKRMVEQKLTETEQEVKRLKSDSIHFETSHFHEVQKYKQKILALQEAIQSPQLFSDSISPVAISSMNASGNSSSDRDYSNTLLYRINPSAKKTVPVLWGDNNNESSENRMRSKSHGRTMLPGYLLAKEKPLVDTDRRRSRSGALYYSSGGSNEDFSPPPEMALLPGVPPPPSVTVKRPTVISRPIGQCH